MTVKLQIVSVLFSLGFLAFIFELVRRKLLRENHSLVWFFVGGGFLFVSIFGDHVQGVAEFFGFIQASNAIMVYAIFLILVLMLGLTVAVSRLSMLVQRLTQEMGLLKNRLEEKVEKARPSADETGGE